MIAPSLARIEKGVDTAERSTNVTEIGVKGALYPYHTYTEPNNPTVVPEEILKQFHFTFLIRHPRFSIPSYYRCTIPPLDKITGFYNFMPSEAGYNELRRVFDYLRSIGQIGPRVTGQDNAATENPKDGGPGKVDICLVDADDLLDNPNKIIEAYCKSVGVQYDPEMLEWTEVNQQQAKDAFEKWSGFHEDAIHSSSLKPRLKVSFDLCSYINSSDIVRSLHESNKANLLVEEAVQNQRGGRRRVARKVWAGRGSDNP